MFELNFKGEDSTPTHEKTPIGTPGVPHQFMALVKLITHIRQPKKRSGSNGIFLEPNTNQDVQGTDSY